MPETRIPRNTAITRVRTSPTAQVGTSRTAPQRIAPNRPDVSGTVVRRRRGAEVIQEQEEFEESQVVAAEAESEAEQEQPTRKRIGLLTAIGLVFLAIIFDSSEVALDLVGTAGAGIFVVIGLLKDVVSFFLWPILFLLLRVPIWKGRHAKKKVTTQITTVLVEAVPWVGAILPGTTISVIVTILFTWAEDRGKNAKREVQRNIVRARRMAQRFRK